MTRNNNSKSTYTPSYSTLINFDTNDENFNLPDLSGLRDDEKQHILNVLLRDENLRSKHLSRFIQLKKEVAELEKQSQTTSPSVCARCHAPFGFLFNTGDICPKCDAKVCKQCRLMYNFNDNGWVCQLCSKQMQLLSYSGEWIYSLQNNLRKGSVSASEVIRKSLSPPISTLIENEGSSSETETADTPYSSNGNLTSSQTNMSNQQLSNNNNNNTLIIQTTSDEDKLNTIRQNAQKRSYDHILSSQQSRKSPSSSTHQRDGSSDDGDSVFDQSTVYSERSAPPDIRINSNNQYQGRNTLMRESIDSISTIHTQPDNNYLNKPDDCASVTSSEWGLESERGEPMTPTPQNASIKSNSKRSLSSRMHLTDSIQSLREAAHRFPKANLSGSRTSINSEPKSQAELSDKQNKSNSHLKLTTTNDSNSRLHESSSTLTPDGSNQQLNQSRKSETSQLHGSSNTLASQGSNQKLNVAMKPEKFTSVGNLNVIDDNDNDSDDDIDGTFEKAKLSLQKRASSFRDIRGSQASLNSVLSDTKARYGLDISGTIELKLGYALKTGALDVLINKCTNLAKASKLRTSDPYVKIYLLPDRSKNSKRKTAIKKNTVDPIFEEKFRYHVTKHDFETRVLWISVWSQTSVGHNDFLGEIHIPLAHCTLDKIEEFKLLAKKHKHDLTPTMEPTMDLGEIKFELTFLENRKAKGIGILQVRNVEGKSIYHGKNPVKAVCKGLLMPDNIKQKLATIREGPTPRWEVPLRWEGVRLDNLQNTSIEISIWSQEPFRKTNLGFVRLNLAHGHFDNKPAKWLDSTNVEKAVWQAFIDKPTEVHQVKLPLRPAIAENK